MHLFLGGESKSEEKVYKNLRGEISDVKVILEIKSRTK